MKVIGFGNTFMIHGDDLKTYGELPVGTYKINFNPMQGFSLESTYNYTQQEAKIYGGLQHRVDKAFKTFAQFKRSLGIILSGNKGMGKSLYTQLLAEKAVEVGMPVLLVADAYPGIANFLESIEQECLVIFDEFEKVFNGDNDNNESQEKLLGLFDGTSQQKRMYALTVNDLHRVNSFMINRPGRFHYHIRIDYPTAEEITEYLQDKIDEKYHGEISKVVLFGKKVALNYDSLRAIAFEIDNGYTFEEALADLNILNIEPQVYDVTVELKSAEGTPLKPIVRSGVYLDLFSDRARVEYDGYDDRVVVNFNPLELVEYDGMMMSLGETATFNQYDSDSTDYKKGAEVTKITVKPSAAERLHY